MAEPFSYRTERRLWLSLVESALVVVFLWIAAAYEAPWWIWAVWVPAAAGLAWHAWLAPPAGTEIDGGHLTFYSGRTKVRHALADIARVSVTSWSDGPDSYTITLRSGQEVRPPVRAQPPGRTLGEALEAHGIEVDFR